MTMKISELWTQEEDEILEKNYKDNHKNLKELLPKRSKSAISSRAQNKGLKIKKNNNLENLLSETSEAYYWIGFLLADGHANKDRGILILQLSRKDRDHLEKFSKFIKSWNIEDIVQNGFESSRLISCNKISIKDIMNKFDWDHNKTYNPPTNLKIKDDNLFMSLLIGYIDGDGSIHKRSEGTGDYLRFKVHSSWKDI